jgi:ABC-type glutathione transport system ATPase component
MMHAEPLLQIENARFAYAGHGAAKPTVDGVTLAVGRGETLGLVGESGCGKSTLARLAVGLLRADEGGVRVMGVDVAAAGAAARLARARRVQMVFQDPYGSLNPRLRIRTLLAEPLRLHRLTTPDQEKSAVDELLRQVGLPPTASDKFPHELSGGQRQRVAIARALDVSIQAQILNLLRDLQQQLGLSYFFISHDLRVVRYIADRIAVMYQGRIVETGPTDTVWQAPQHPYTQKLLASLPPELSDLQAAPAV